MQQQIQYIKTNQLHESSMNPRKEFHQESIDQLAESIKQVGILQPIIARLNTSVKQKKIPIYEVVCGARRLSAAVIADLEEVPVIVRELSDDEALDLMITENLQRKDVSPLEEAEAYEGLMNKRGYDIDTIVSRFGKSESYIRHRLKLNDLILSFKLLLKHEVIGIGHALEICKLQEKDQTELYNNQFSQEDRSKRWWSCPSIKLLKNNIEQEFTLKLEKAPFSLDDKTLDKKAGPCTTCPKNTASNLILFPDSPSTGVCLDRSCFKRKSDIHFDRELKRVQEDEPGVILAYPGYLYGEEEKRVAGMKKNGTPAVEVSWKTGWMEVSEPEKPEVPQESEFDDPDDYKEALSDYEVEVSDYEEQVKDYQEKLSAGVLRKAFMLAGNNKGKVVFLEPREQEESQSSGDTGTYYAGQQIQELEAKDRRNQELTFEKLYVSAKGLLKDEGYNNITDQLTDNEMTALYLVMLALIDTDLSNEIYGGDHGRWVENELKLPAALRLTAEQKIRVMRHWLYHNLNTGSPLFQISEAKALIEITRERYPEQLTQVELELQGKYLKRKEKIDQLIEDLKASTGKSLKHGSQSEAQV